MFLWNTLVDMDFTDLELDFNLTEMDLSWSYTRLNLHRLRSSPPRPSWTDNCLFAKNGLYFAGNALHFAGNRLQFAWNGFHIAGNELQFAGNALPYFNFWSLFSMGEVLFSTAIYKWTWLFQNKVFLTDFTRWKCTKFQTSARQDPQLVSSAKRGWARTRVRPPNIAWNESYLIFQQTISLENSGWFQTQHKFKVIGKHMVTGNW